MFRRGRAFQIKKPPETLQLTRALTRMHAERIAAFLSADCCHPCPPPLFPRPAPLPLPGPLFFCFLLAIMLFVVNGLHMRGGPLSSQLEAAGGTYVRDAQTVPQYTLHAIKPLAAAPPSLTHRGMPGLLYHPPCHHDHATASILVEVWDIPDSAIGGVSSQACRRRLRLGRSASWRPRGTGVRRRCSRALFAKAGCGGGAFVKGWR